MIVFQIRHNDLGYTNVDLIPSRGVVAGFTGFKQTARIFLRGHRGRFFADVGRPGIRMSRARSWCQLKPTGNLKLNPEHVFIGYGFGTRVNLGVFLLNLDFAWPTHLSASGSIKIFWSPGNKF